MTEMQLLEKRRELLLAEIEAIDLRTDFIRKEQRHDDLNACNTPIRMLTIKDAATEAGLSCDFVRKLCKRNEIVFVKAGTKTLVNWSSLEEYLRTGGVIA